MRSDPPAVDDFRSAHALGKPLLDPRYEREWAEGISVYDDMAYAIDRAVKLRLQLGRYVVAVEIPDQAKFDAAQTTRDPRHYTLYAPAEQLLGLVRGPAIDATGE